MSMRGPLGKVLGVGEPNFRVLTAAGSRLAPIGKWDVLVARMHSRTGDIDQPGDIAETSEPAHPCSPPALSRCQVSRKRLGIVAPRSTARLATARPRIRCIDRA